MYKNGDRLLFITLFAHAGALVGGMIGSCVPPPGVWVGALAGMFLGLCHGVRRSRP